MAIQRCHGSVARRREKEKGEVKKNRDSG